MAIKKINLLLLLLFHSHILIAGEEVQDVFIPPLQPKNSYIEISHSNDWLTNRYANWQSNNISIYMPMKEKGTTTLEFSQTKRYGLEDQSAYLNYSYPTSKGSINAELGMTPNADFLYKRLYGLGWNGIIGDGFGYIVSYKQRDYSDSLSDAINLTAERYFDDYRIAYTNIQSSLNKHQLETTHRIQFQWIAENNNRLGISYSSGKEPLDLGFHQISSSNVKQLQIDGVYWIKDIGISASAWHVVQGEFYNRNGAQIGLRMAF